MAAGALVSSIVCAPPCSSSSSHVVGRRLRDVRLDSGAQVWVMSGAARYRADSLRSTSRWTPCAALVPASAAWAQVVSSGPRRSSFVFLFVSGAAFDPSSECGAQVWCGGVKYAAHRPSSCSLCGRGALRGSGRLGVECAPRDVARTQVARHLACGRSSGLAVRRSFFGFGPLLRGSVSTFRCASRYVSQRR